MANKNNGKNKDKRIFIFCDLDNTVLYSKSKKKENDICVERKLKAEQGFMNEDMLDAIYDVEFSSNMRFIPVTSRSVEQFVRINRLAELCDYAITSNGANLLKSSVQDKEWWVDSYDSCKKTLDYIAGIFKYANNTLSSDVSSICRLVDGFWMYAAIKSEDIKKKVIEHSADMHNVYFLDEDIKVYDTGSKISVIPTAISKGVAVKRFIEMYKKNFGNNLEIETYAFGDNILDIPMLESVDHGYGIEALRDKVTTGNVEFYDGKDRFDTFVLAKITEILEQKKW